MFLRFSSGRLTQILSYIFLLYCALCSAWCMFTDGRFACRNHAQPETQQQQLAFLPDHAEDREQSVNLGTTHRGVTRKIFLFIHLVFLPLFSYGDSAWKKTAGSYEFTQTHREGKNLGGNVFLLRNFGRFLTQIEGTKAGGAHCALGCRNRASVELCRALSCARISIFHFHLKIFFIPIFYFHFFQFFKHNF